MHIVVCVKQVPDTNDVKTDTSTGRIIREGVPSIVNPDDRHAVEEALRLRDTHGGEVTLLSMGPPQAAAALKEMLAMGADRAVLLCDPLFAGADTWATSYTLGCAVKKIGVPEVILCGRQAIDGDTAQVGPQLAEFLGIAQVTHVREVIWDGERFMVKRTLEEGYAEILVQPPVLFTAVSELNAPRYPTMKQIILSHRKKKIEIWDAEKCGADTSKTGLTGSPTQVKRVFVPEPPPKGEILPGTPEQQVAGFVQKCLQLNLVP